MLRPVSDIAHHYMVHCKILGQTQNYKITKFTKLFPVKGRAANKSRCPRWFDLISIRLFSECALCHKNYFMSEKAFVLQILEVGSPGVNSLLFTFFQLQHRKFHTSEMRLLCSYTVLRCNMGFGSLLASDASRKPDSIILSRHVWGRFLWCSV